MTEARPGLAAGLVALCLALGAGGCAPASNVEAGGTAATTDPTRWIDPEAAAREYASQARTLELAPGWSWPVEPVARTGPDDEPVLYERGFGRHEAQFHWYCSWARTSLQRSLSRADRRHALSQALRLRELDYFREGLNPRNQKHVAHILSSAESGVLHGLRRDVEQNCPAR